MSWLFLAVAIPSGLLLMLVVLTGLARKIPAYHGDDYLMYKEVTARKSAKKGRRSAQAARPRPRDTGMPGLSQPTPHT